MPASTLRERWRSLLPEGVPWYRQRLLRIAAGVLASYAAVGFLLLPAVLKHMLPGSLHDALGVQASLSGVSFNPFTLRLEMRDLRVNEANGVPLASVQRIVADAEASSLFHWAWTFAEISLDQPELDLVIEKDGRLNLARVALALPPEPDANADEAPARILLHRVDLRAARLRFSDLSGAAPASTEIGPSDLHVTRLSTLPGQRGIGTLDVQMAGGARMSWEGEIGLHPLASAGTLRLAELKPAAFHDFLRSQLLLDPVGGSLALSLAYELAAAGEKLSFSTHDMRLDLRDLLLRKPGAAKPLLSLGAVTVEGGSFDLAGNRLVVGNLGISGGALAAGIDVNDVLDWETLVVPAASATVAVPAQAPAPWSAEVANVAIDGISVDVYDQTRNAPLGLALTLKRAGFAVQAGPGKEGPAIRLSGAALEAADIALSTGAERAALGTIARLELAGAEVDVAAEQLSAARLSIDGLHTALHRERDGSIREISLASVPDPVTPLPVTHAASEWRVRLGEFRLGGLDLALADTGTTPAITYAVAGGSLSLKNIDTAGTTPLQLEAKLPVSQGGEISLSGTASADGSTADVALRIATLALSPLAPLVAQDTTLLLDAGTLSTQLDIAYRSPAADPLALRVSGGASLDGLRLREAEGGGHFLGWTSLEAAGLDFSLGPDHLGITELRLKGADAKVVVQKDRSVNLAGVMREPATAPEARGPTTAVASAAPAGASATPSPPVSEAASAPEAFPVVIDRIRVENSVVDFADYSLVLPFAARIEGLKGVAKGISSDANGRATLAFSGRVGEYGEADIDGQLAPFDPTHFTDIEIAFRNIALTPLSPYSATFAGRTIKAGDLDLSLQYKVDNQKLLGKNEVVLQNFKLGESVKSKDAVSLPLDLAIALLSDSKGRIDLAVPVSGDVGDPKFSYGHLIWKAIGNLITGVVTAPFRALGSLFGGAEEQVQAIRFKSGSAELMPMERQRIAKVATALSQRPRLAVRVPAATHAERDGYALRRFELRRLHATEMGYELAAGEDPGPVSYSNGRSQRALEKLLAVRGGDDAADRFAASWAKKQGREPERVNAALALVGRGSPDHEFYRAMYLELVNTTPEPPGGMQALAAARAEAISAEFRTRGVEAARVSIGKAAPMQKAKPSGVMLPLELLAAG